MPKICEFDVDPELLKLLGADKLDRLNRAQQYALEVLPAILATYKNDLRTKEIRTKELSEGALAIATAANELNAKIQDFTDKMFNVDGLVGGISDEFREMLRELSRVAQAAHEGLLPLSETSDLMQIIMAQIATLGTGNIARPDIGGKGGIETRQTRGGPKTRFVRALATLVWFPFKGKPTGTTTGPFAEFVRKAHECATSEIAT